MTSVYGAARGSSGEAARRLLKIAVLLSAILFFAVSAGAQENQKVTSTAFSELEPTETLEVRAGRDLPLERDLVIEVSRLLQARGFVVAERGDVIVTVNSTTALPGIQSRNAFTNDDRLRTMDNTRNDRAVLVPFNNREVEPGASNFTLRMSAYRPGQSNLWVGTASAPDNGSGRRGTTIGLAKSLVAVFGASTPDTAEN